MKKIAACILGAFLAAGCGSGSHAPGSDSYLVRLDGTLLPQGGTLTALTPLGPDVVVSVPRAAVSTPTAVQIDVKVAPGVADIAVSGVHDLAVPVRVQLPVPPGSAGPLKAFDHSNGGRRELSLRSDGRNVFALAHGTGGSIVEFETDHFSEIAVERLDADVDLARQYTHEVTIAGYKFRISNFIADDAVVNGLPFSLEAGLSSAAERRKIAAEIFEDLLLRDARLQSTAAHFADGFLEQADSVLGAAGQVTGAGEVLVYRTGSGTPRVISRIARNWLGWAPTANLRYAGERFSDMVTALDVAVVAAQANVILREEMFDFLALMSIRLGMLDARIDELDALFAHASAIEPQLYAGYQDARRHAREVADQIVGSIAQAVVDHGRQTIEVGVDAVLLALGEALDVASGPMALVTLIVGADVEGIFGLLDFDRSVMRMHVAATLALETFGGTDAVAESCRTFLIGRFYGYGKTIWHEGFAEKLGRILAEGWSYLNGTSTSATLERLFDLWSDRYEENFALAGGEILEGEFGSLSGQQTVSPTSVDDYGDDAGHATTITLGQPVAGALERPGDVDVFRFDAHASGPLSAGTLGATDTVVTVSDAHGAQVANDDDGGPSLNALVHWSAAAGTTDYIAVRHYHG
ncbi:MAG TPA: hypothetical protein VHF22_02065, partial [Planctomycetota bacterium]|nr:hypothetical protein [Planctomycetota bacterium]